MRVETYLSVFVALAGIAAAETDGDFESRPADAAQRSTMVGSRESGNRAEAAPCQAIADAAEAAGCWLARAEHFEALGNLREWREAAARRAAILEKTLAADDPRLAVARNNLSVVSRLAGDLKGADELNRQALGVLRAKPTPELATVINNRGQILANEGRWKQARDGYREAIALWERQYGPRDPRVAMGLANLAALMQARKEFDETEKLLTRVIAIDRESFPEESPRIALDWNSLGVLCALRKKNEEAERDFRKSLDILERTRPAGHPDIGEVRVNLAELLHREGRIEESEPLFRGGLEILSRAWGAESPRLLIWLDDYVAVLRARQDFAEAEKVQLQATRIRVGGSRRG